MLFKSVAVAALLSVAQAVDVQVVAVGVNPVNNQTASKFYPDSIKAAAGSMVQFQFWAGNHTVTQSNFDNPCVPLSESNSSAVGIDSQHQPVSDSEDVGEIPTYTVMVNDTSPLWFYCKTGSHCQGGMSLVVNEDTQANQSRSLAAYKEAAQSVASPTTGDAAGSGGSGGSDGSGGTAGSTTETPGSGASVLSVSSSVFLAIGAAFMLL